MSQTSNTHVVGESDGRIVPTKGPNSAGQPLGEGLEGRPSAKENNRAARRFRTQSRAKAAHTDCPVVRGASHQGIGDRRRRQHPRQEPYEVILHVRIRAGGAG